VRARRLRQDAIWRESNGEIIAVDDRLTTYVSTSGTGALLWKRLADGATPDELADQLVSEFAIDRERAVEDVDAFLAELDAQKLLED
jgi:hypothetical protein